MDISLKGGPCDGETHQRIPDHCVILRRHAKGPNARYKTTGTDDADGRRLFEHFPPRPGEPEPTEGVHDV
jgi:hypothetical protein